MENAMYNEEYFEPDKQGRYANTRLFLKKAAEAMDLPSDTAEESARVILRRIKEYLSEDAGDHFVSQLPLGLKEECSRVRPKRAKSEISAKSLKADLFRINSQVPGADSAAIARGFWRFLMEWIGNDPYFNQGEGKDILSSLPEDMEKLFRGGLN